ncbi:hypothetical protein ACFWV1_24765 [Streptomyces sp. NPDC058700]
MGHTEYGPEGRVTRFRVERTVGDPGGQPLRWPPPRYSPSNPSTT